MLKISSDARKASMDIRMAPAWDDPTTGERADPEPNPKGKIPLAAVNVAEIYRTEMPDKGVQMVFLDLGTPKASTAKNDEELDREEGKGDELDGSGRGHAEGPLPSHETTAGERGSAGR